MEKEERMEDTCVRWQGGSSRLGAHNLLHSLYLHISKPSCNIASQSSDVVCCRSHQFSASLSFICNLFVWPTSSYSNHLSRATSCPCVTGCISCHLLYNPHRLGDSLRNQKFCRTSLQAQGFHSHLMCKSGTIKPSMGSHNRLKAVYVWPQ